MPDVNITVQPQATTVVVRQFPVFGNTAGTVAAGDDARFSSTDAHPDLRPATRLRIPTNAPASPEAGDVYRVANTLRYRDGSGVERLLLNAADNLANLSSPATARTNLGLTDLATATVAAATFTPTIAGTTTTGVGTYSTQIGRYVRIGNLCYISVHLVWTGLTGTGNLRVNGLPFTAASATIFPSRAESLVFTAIPKVFVAAGDAFALVIVESSGNVPAGVAVDTTATLQFSGIYEITP